MSSHVTARPLITTVILNTNRRQDTLACLASLEKNTYPNQAILVLDNASTDGSVEHLCAFFPQVLIIENPENLGVAVFANLERNMARVAIRNWIYDHYLGVDETDWAARYGKWRDGLWSSIDEMAAEAHRDRDPESAPSLPLARFTGRYHDDLIGDLEISLTEPGTLSLRLGDIIKMPLEHWQFNTFRIEWSNPLISYPAPSLLNFELIVDGAPMRAVLSGPADAVFKRVE